MKQNRSPLSSGFEAASDWPANFTTQAITDANITSCHLSSRRVALLTNILLPYRVALMNAFASLFPNLRIFLSARSEPDRKDKVSWDSLNITVQSSLSWTHQFRHIHNYADVTHIHIPYDTLLQLRRCRPDVIISSEFGARTIQAALYCMLWRNTRLIVWATISQRTEATRGRIRKIIRRWTLSRVDGAFANGDDTEQYLRGLGYRGQIFIIPYVIENARFAGPSTVPDDMVKRLFFSGQLIERKGILPFYTGLCGWCRSHPDVRVNFSLAGDGPLRKKLEAIDPPPSLSVSFLGYLTQEELAKAYHESSMYVFPTLADEWGVVVNEALSAGVPVMGSIYSQAVEQLIREGHNGWKFDPSDAAGIQRVLNTALNTDPQTMLKMSHNALESIAELTPSVIALRMARAINSVTPRQIEFGGTRS